MKKVVLAFVAVAGAGLLGWGGMTLKRSMECRGLEEDYLNSASNLRRSVALKSLDSAEVTEVADRLQDLEFARMEGTLDRLYGECGTRAGQTAARKASNVLLAR